MEANVCDINHLDTDVLLPPRKRLLAGFKKQSSDSANGDSSSHPSQVVSTSQPSPVASTSQPSPVASTSQPSPIATTSQPSPNASTPLPSLNASTSLPSPVACTSQPSPVANSSQPSQLANLTELNTSLKNRLTSYLKNPNFTPEELAEASRSAATAAVKAAKVARATAEEKAAKAVKAMATANSALDLVASFSEEAARKDRYLKKNKLKKHVPVHLLYKKHQPVENYKTDEELARRLHRAINSSPRILKNSSSSDGRSRKHKKLKSSQASEITRVSNGDVVLEANQPSKCNGHALAGEVDSEHSIREAYKFKKDENASTFYKDGHFERDNGEGETSHSKEKTWEDSCYPGKKRGRGKLKKLPLSICTSRDQSNPKEEINNRSFTLTDKNMGNSTAGNMPLFSMEPSADGVMPNEATSMWKCQDFKAPTSIKQNKIVQS